MKVTLVFLQLSIVLGLSQASHADVLIDQSKYTCAQLTKILNDHGSIWVRNRAFPFIKQNIALYNPVCNGSARSHPRRICNYYRGYVTAKDGGCNLGRECSCSPPSRDDD
jgi:hypothetical protein